MVCSLGFLVASDILDMVLEKLPTQKCRTKIFSSPAKNSSSWTKEEES
jgi:hypothetical protein